MFLDVSEDELGTSDPAERARFAVMQTHEQSHWVHHHASTAGLWLTVLRRTRDALARTWLTEQLTPAQRSAAQQWRAGGRPLVGFAHRGDVVTWLGSDPDAAAATWLNLDMAVRLFEGADPTGGGESMQTTVASDPGAHSVAERSGSADTARTLAVERFLRMADSFGAPDRATVAVGDAAITAWMNGEALGGLPVTVDDLYQLMPEPVSLRHELDQGLPLSTALLSECASTLDEFLVALGLPATPAEVRDRAARKLTRHPYGWPWRLANDGAEYTLTPDTMLVLLDFAANPPIPGLDPDARDLRWSHVYPPWRLLNAAAALRRDGASMQVAERPDAAAVTEFQRRLSEISGIPSGRGAAPPALSGDLNAVVREFAGRGSSVFYAAAAHDAAQLLAYRARAPHLVTHVSSQLLASDGGRLAGWAPEVMPPLWTLRSELMFRRDLGHAEGNELLRGTAVACAMDDVLTGTGPLSRGHLPEALFASPGAARVVEDGVRHVTGLTVRF